MNKRKRLAAELAILQKIRAEWSRFGMWKSSRYQKREREVIHLLANC